MGLHVQEAHLKVRIWTECENAISVLQPLCWEFVFCLNLDFTRAAVPSTGLTELCQEVVRVVLPSSDTHPLVKQTPCFSRIKVYHFPDWCSLGHMPVSLQERLGRCLSPEEENHMTRN